MNHFRLIIIFFICVRALWAAPGSSWEMLASSHFQIYHQPREPLAQEVLDIAEDFYPRLDRLISDMAMGPIEIWICETEKQFRSAVHAPIQDWAVGCAFPLSRRIVIQNPRVIIDREFQLAQVIRHEIVHIAFGQRTKDTIGEIPLWFVEGIAIYLSGEWAPHRHDVLLDHVFSRSIIPLGDLTKRFPESKERAQLAYAESLNAVKWVVEIAGVEKLWEIIDRLGQGNDLNTAYKAAIGWDLMTFDAEWRKSLLRRYRWVALFSNSYLFWGSLALLFALSYVLYRRRTRRRLAELDQEESQVDVFFQGIEDSRHTRE